MKWHDSGWVGAYGQWASVGVAVLGFTLVFWQLWLSNQQQMLAAKAATSQLYGLVTTTMASVTAIFQKEDGWQKFFFENEPVPDTPPDLHEKLLIACDVVMNFVDAIVEQKRALPDQVATDWTTWETYMRDLYSKSPIFQEYVKVNLRYFPDYTFAALGYLIVRSPVDGKWLSAWKVVEPNPFGEPNEPGGYPWIRTWVFEQLKPSETPRVEAVVTGQSTNEVLVTVKGELKDVSKRELCVIQYWIIGTMEGTGVKNVRIEYPDAAVPEGTRYGTGRLKRGARTFAFLIPEYAPLGIFGVSLEAWFGAATAPKAPVPS